MSIRRLFVAAFLIALFAMATRPTLDPDMWWHLRTGESILSNGVPTVDIFSFTVPGQPWVTHEWLSQVVMWLVWRLAGFAGLILFFAGLTTLTFWLVYRRSAGRPYLAGFVVLWSALSSSIVWGARPQLFNLLLTATFVFLVDGVRQRHLRPRYLWLLPLLTMVWANLHSGYLLGIVLLATYLAGELLRRWQGEDGGMSWSEIGLLSAVIVTSFLAAALNPSGAELWVYPFQTLGSGAMQAYIQEWHSPDFHQAIFWMFGGYLLLGVGALATSPQRPTPTDLLLFLGTAAASLLSARHIPLFALVTAPIISRHLAYRGESVTSLWPLLRQPQKQQSSSWLNGIVALLCVLGAVVWAWQTIATNERRIAERYPVAAVEYLQRNDMAQLRGYNHYNWGGYLIWRDIAVFVDGRADVYGDAFLHQYRKTFDTQPDWQEPLRRYQIEYVLMETGDPVTVLLSNSSGWRLAYGDDVAEIFVRNSE